MKLNLGCGNDYRKGWVNVDADRSVKADLYFDLTDVFPFKSESFDYILAQDVLEHLTYKQAKAFLSECYRVLKPECILKIRVPNLYDIFNRFKSDPDVLFKFVYGDTQKHSFYGLHKYGYTKETLEKHLARAGFKVVSAEYVATNLVVRAKKIKLGRFDIKLAISLLDSGGYGGSEVFLLSLARAIKTQAYVVFLSLTNSLVNQKLSSAKIDYKLINYRDDLIGDWKGFIKFFVLLPYSILKYVKILKALRRQEVSVIILPGFTDKILLSPLAKLMGFTVIWQIYSGFGNLLKKYFFLPKVLIRLSSKFVDLLICPTYYAKTQIIPELRVSESKIKQIPCGLRLLKAKERKKYLLKKDKIKKKLGLKGFVLGQVSRLDKHKGQDILIKSLKYLKKRLDNFSLVIVGEGFQDQRLKSLVKQLEVGNYVKFTSFYSDVYEILSCFDLFVFPTQWQLEGFGLAPFEAVNLGIPVILSKHAVLQEIWQDESWFFEANPKSLAEKIIEFYRLNQSDKEKLLKRQQKLLERYDIEKVAKYYLKEIESLYKIRLILDH
ncbi:MAG: hypothetical protein KatS3mg090_0459 [Patescibacteria group bacterium]|nr:MAG: hypothetical protein KatS3mg090_0459 [Patescibacteria group bacterium]